MDEKSVIHLFERDILPIQGLDHVLLPINNPETAVFIKLSNISRLEPAVMEGLLVLLFQIKISLGDGRSTYPDLALWQWSVI